MTVDTPVDLNLTYIDVACFIYIIRYTNHYFIPICIFIFFRIKSNASLVAIMFIVANLLQQKQSLQ